MVNFNARGLRFFLEVLLHDYKTLYFLHLLWKIFFDKDARFLQCMEVVWTSISLSKVQYEVVVRKCKLEHSMEVVGRSRGASKVL